MANFTRKHYQQIAEIINTGLINAPTSDYNKGWNRSRYFMAKELSARFAADNENFNRDRFMKACGFNACP